MSGKIEANEMRIGALSPVQIREVVAIHVEAFPRSATSILGPEVVRRYYEWQFLGPHQAHYIGVWVRDQLAGFCFGGTFHGAMVGFLSRNKWFLFRYVLLRPWLIGNWEVQSAIGNAMCRLLMPRGKPRAITNIRGAERRFGILVIAVAPRWRRLGLGGELMKAAEEIAKQTGYEAMGLSVRPENTSAVKFYTALGWESAGDTPKLRGVLQKRITAPIDSVQSCDSEPT